jgi:DUF971 family protein
MQQHADTDELRLSKDRQILTLSRGTDRAELTAAALRRACRCAGCESARRSGQSPAVADNMTISGIDPMGPFAFNVQFSDGHARGVFPWAYLWQLASSSTMDPA